MRKIRTISVMIVFSIVFVLLTSCGFIDGYIEGYNSGDNETISNQTNKEEIYSKLSDLVLHPQNINYSSIYDTPVTFTVMLLSSPEVFEFAEEDGGNQTYAYAVLARNLDQPFLLNFENISSDLVDYEFATVTGRPIGYVIDNEKVELLDVEIDTIESFEPLNEPQFTDRIEAIDRENTNGIKDVYTFTESVAGADVFYHDMATLYFNFTNEQEFESLPDLSEMFFYQGDRLLRTCYESTLEPLNSSALDALGMGNAHKTPPQETLLYYVHLKTKYSDDAPINADEPITAVYFDDDFNLVSEVEIPIRQGESFESIE